jgi:membrane protein
VQFQELLEQSGGLARALAATMSVMFPLLATWLVLGAMYKLMPTTTVSLRAATIGSFVAAVLWFIAIELMRLYVARTATGTFYGALYGALALLPLFLLWLWVTWVIILFGLELTYTLQTLRSRQEMELQARREVRIVGDPLWLVPMMTRIARAFAAGKPIPDDDLADALQLPLRSVTQLGEHLEAAGLIHRVQSVGRTDGGFALALPPDRIHVTQLLELGRSLTMGDQTQRLGPDWAVLDQLAQAQQQAAAQMTLQQVLDSASREEQKT